MPHPVLSAVVSCARRAVAREPGEVSDGRLLADYLAARDADAFASLVARFGPMVFAVCRRVTGHHQDAEDAFQATFVVLARKAASVVPREAVGNWLYGVAVRTAREARAMAARRLAREVLVARPPEVARAQPNPDDLATVLHEELAALPDKSRTLLVLCDLRGEAQTQVASRLGLPVGTVYSRLAKARALLAERLRKRGVSLPTLGLTAILAQAGRAAVPAGLSAKTVAEALSPDSVPAPVAALANGVFQTMLLRKLTVAGVAALLLAACALAANPATSPTDPPKPVLKAAFTPVAAPAPKPLPKAPNKLLFWNNGRLTLIDPDGKNEKKLLTDDKVTRPVRDQVRLSPDGTMVAFIAEVETPDDPIPGQMRPWLLFVAGVDDKERKYLDVSACSFAWSPDGTEIAYTYHTDPVKRPATAHGIINVKTKETTVLKLPADHLITDWSRDGKFFLTTRVATPVNNPQRRMYLMNRDGTEHKVLTDEKQVGSHGLLSPDGKRVLFELQVPKMAFRNNEPRQVLAILDIASGDLRQAGDVPPNASLRGYCWSPDGARIAYAWLELPERETFDKDVASHLVVCDSDGKNAKTIATEKGKGQWHVTIGGVDWR